MFRSSATLVRRTRFRHLFFASFIGAIVLLALLHQKNASIPFAQETIDEPVTYQSSSAEITKTITTTTTAPTVKTLNATIDETDNRNKDTTLFAFNEPNCGELNGTYNIMMVIVFSRINHLEARNAIRQTWGNNIKERGDRVYFLIGSSENETLNTAINDEKNSYGDIIQAKSNENNEIGLTMDMHEFIITRCSKSVYVFKTTDDAFVNPSMVERYYPSKLGLYIVGKTISDWHPGDDLRPYLPETILQTKKFETFVAGQSYMFEPKVSEPIYRAILSFNYTDYSVIPDVFLNGIALIKAKVERRSDKSIVNPDSTVDSCSYPKYFASHGQTPDDIIRLWHDVYNTECKKTAPTVAANNSAGKKTI